MATYHSGHCAPELGRCLAAFPHVTVIDNASSDDTVAQVREHLPHARIIVNERNRGFGAANNQGVWAATTEFVLLLNPDCVIGADDGIAMIQAADRYPKASAIGPQLSGKRGYLDLSYGWTPGSWSPKGPGAEADTCVGFISGACMLIRREAMIQIQGFDEDFFLYQEDTDLCMRLAQQCGELILAPKATVKHLSRSSSSGKGRFKAEYLRGYHHIQSKFLFELKHLGVQVSTARRWRYCATAALEMLARVLVLDVVRATRVFGRVIGAIRYPRDRKLRRTDAKHVI
ncbi:MAG: glycosyltransferase family 2 protein [Aquabacterium sp.]|uniref:glycosyltransferase family 2 protein n=1 Tax=Aquabacterium sp. TaxID=1872578 RepID=UPI002720A975|nr:glycosyltransferase family 2 protein [Aquabacterium sp.]MDO9006025.1 glycosyltransferase family 2 protein [Aquabacterium sp.]